MRIVRSCLLAAAVALAGIMSAHAPAHAQTPAASSPSEVSKVKTWTRTRLETAKKRWAEDKARFSDCSDKLDEQQRKKKLSLHRQGHFLQDCMTRKP